MAARRHGSVTWECARQFVGNSNGLAILFRLVRKEVVDLQRHASRALANLALNGKRALLCARATLSCVRVCVRVYTQTR